LHWCKTHTIHLYKYNMLQLLRKFIIGVCVLAEVLSFFLFLFFILCRKYIKYTFSITEWIIIRIKWIKIRFRNEYLFIVSWHVVDVISIHKSLESGISKCNRNARFVVKKNNIRYASFSQYKPIGSNKLLTELTKN